VVAAAIAVVEEAKAVEAVEEVEVVLLEPMNKEIPYLMLKRNKEVDSKENQEVNMLSTSNLELAEALESPMRKRAVMVVVTGVPNQIVLTKGDKLMKVFPRVKFLKRCLLKLLQPINQLHLR
jgi:hypothetical protein